ncbi:IclR family transcriptional regulator [Xylophilus sp. ASV27]|uniref:IclR family transcriptional regulator n=1 Tax=Xylophilus sp. ASV27 TaxID=2795129 RepID=UPI0018EA7117|nr:IclR family transcriptional regulator C-terminal domain-containing protein [Xylophilus sp. ASV27]
MVPKKQEQLPSEGAGPMSEEAPPPAKDPYWVDALAQGLAVLHVFDGDRPALTLSEIAASLGWSRTKPFRFVHTLEKLGYLARDESGRAFRLTSRSMQLGFAYLSRVPLVELAQPVLDRLRTQVAASAHLAILESSEVVYIAQARVKLPTAINIHVGSRLPAYATSIGRILLAHQSEDALDEIIGAQPLQAHTAKSTVDPKTLRRNLRQAREQGFIFNDGEFQEGIRSVAAAILDARGNAVAGINATATSYVFDDETVATVVIPAVCSAAMELSRSLGFAERDKEAGALPHA